MPNALVSLLLAVSVGATSEATVSLTAGGTRTGVVERWDAKGLRLRDGDEAHDLATSEVLDVRWSGAEVAGGDDDATRPRLELVDGASLPYDEFTVAKRVARVTSPALGELSIPTEKISRVDLQPRTEVAEAAWQQLSERELAGDVLVVAKREGESVDYLTGVVGDVTADQTKFDWDGETVAVKRTKIVGIAFYHARAPELAEPICELTTADGSTIPVRQIELDGDVVQVTTPSAVRLEVPLSQLARADYSSGKLAYLSDLTPVESRWTPLIGAPAGAQLAGAAGEPRRDASFNGSALTLLWKDDPLPDRRDVRTYAKGLALRSRTELTYRLPAKMRRFKAIAGIDPATAAQGHVELEILGDDRSLWQGVVDGKRPPAEIDVELGSARRLQIRVDYGENLDYGDRLHLIDASVTK
jgi:hypothetical protein